MTKAVIIAQITEETGLERLEVQKTVEAFMSTIKSSMTNGQNVYLRGFGSFVVKERAEKIGRNITAQKSIVIPAHNIPTFKPAKVFIEEVKTNILVN